MTLDLDRRRIGARDDHRDDLVAKPAAHSSQPEPPGRATGQTTPRYGAKYRVDRLDGSPAPDPDHPDRPPANRCENGNSRIKFEAIIDQSRPSLP